MNVFPAIDIIEGKCVRLTKGLEDQKTIYQKSPVEMAKVYEEIGFKTIHVVDLDATLGKGNNNKVLNDIRESVDIKIEVAGGIRSQKAIEEKLKEGFDIIVIGTFAVKNINEVLQFDDVILNKLSIALDIKDNQIASHGWQQTNTTSLNDIIDQYNKKNIHSFFVTDVANDGMLSGLNMHTFQNIKKLTNKPITIGGGVKDILDIELSKENGFDNVVVGKAIYENKISLESLIKFNA
ncbi:MAG: 1-(5-phosphoribosyl)-5-[(5-phosphoribosylamino)methylideneamino] imidazole-4-carboxamide isomerase [alpha proteobacterium HIMB59]|nr:MAG: 1-(5-phosphoribosyl)-5-[(5-phosphoribosylamino)methylideneamino] imidazole-4-carboxamide isomerase [alpha proteobacterium HIMB59]